MSVGAPELLIEAGSAADAATLDPGAAEIAARSPLELFWRRFRRDRLAMASLGVIVFLVLVAIFAPLIIKAVGAPRPNVQNSGALDQFGTPTGPSPNALLPFDALVAGVFVALIGAALPWAAVRRWAPPVAGGIGLLVAIVLAASYWPSAKHLFGVDPLG